jgi:prephenate dehydrogenase
VINLNDKKKLKQSRDSIEKITVEILDLLSKRLELGRDIAILKNNLNMPLVDPSQERKLYKTIQDESDSLNLNKDFSKKILKLIIEETISREQDHLKKFSTPKKQKIGIIGASGNMGKWFTKFFSEHGYSVGLYSRKFKAKKSQKSKIFKSIRNCVLHSDIILISVPIEKTNKIIADVIKHSDDTKTIIEISSMKKQIVSNMKKLHTTSSLMSIHPLFGPGANVFKSQKFILVPVKSTTSEKKSFSKIFPNSKLIVCNATQHDKSMAYVISLVYFLNLSFIMSLENIPNLKDISGTSFTIQYLLASGIFHDTPEVISSLQISNEQFIEILNNLTLNVNSITQLISNHDDKEFIKIIKKAKKQIISNKKSYDDLYQLVNSIDSF